MSTGSALAVVDWDVDGIASGVILKELGIVEDIFIPPIGEYIFSDLVLDILSEYNNIYFLDFVPSPNSFKRLRKSLITIIDHGVYCPSSNSNIVSKCRETYSTTYLLMEIYKLSPSYEILLGLINDLKEQIRNLSFYRLLRNSLGINEESLDKLLKLIDYFNIPIYFSDINLLYENIRLIESGLKSIDKIPSLKRRMDYIGILDREINRLLSEVVIKNCYAYLEYYGNLYLIRRLPIEVYKFTGLPNVIIDEGYFTDYIQIASYCSSCDFRRLINMFREDGFVVGGGRNFLGIIIKDRIKLDEVLDKIISMF